MNPASLPPLLRSVRGALFPNNAPGKPTLVPPSSDAELRALRRRCARAVWAAACCGSSSGAAAAVGRLYFTGSVGSIGLKMRARGIKQGGNKAAETNKSQVLVINTSSRQKGPSPLPSSSRAERTAGGSGNVSSSGGGDQHLGHHRHSKSFKKTSINREYNASSSSGSGNSSRSGTPSPLAGVEGEEAEDWEILKEIERGILKLFEDGYCNKHLVYGILELVLVRLMPELAEKGALELWAERIPTSVDS